MGKLMLILLVTVFKCYGHYPPGREYLPISTSQDESALNVAQTILRSISNEHGWILRGQSSSIQTQSHPDVIVTIVEYQDKERRSEPALRQYGQRQPYHDPHHSSRPPLPLASPSPSQSPPPPPPPRPPHISNEQYQFGYGQTYQGQYVYERPRLPTIGFDKNQYNNIYVNHYLNSETNSEYNKESSNTHTDGESWTQHQGNYNHQDSNANKKLHNMQTDQRSKSYKTLGFENQNQLNHSSLWYPNNIYQGVQGSQQQSVIGGLISGTLNPINNPSDELSQSSTKLSSPTDEDKAAEEPDFPNFVPLNSTDNKMVPDEPAEEDEDFQIDVRFKGE